MELDGGKNKARTLLLRYLAYRARTSKEAYAYLQKKGFPEQVISETINDLQDLGYLNDRTFTRDFIGYRKGKSFGPRKIRYELLNKGLEKKEVDHLLKSGLGEEEELQTIKALLLKRIPEGGLTDQRWLAKQAAYLQRRGFRDHLIIKALRNYGFGE